MTELPFAITLDVGSSLANKTGAWRTERPVYVSRQPPCSHACPAGEDVRQWLHDAEEDGDGYERAWRTIMRDNPLPAVMGRVCYHPCEAACNRGQLDESVGINSVERFLGDEAIRQAWLPDAVAPASGRRVLVIGSGPSGLSAAYHLALLGHEATVYEAAPRPGGMLRYGIPAYRLPRATLDAEVARIVELGVRIECDRRVGEPLAEMRAGGFDAVFLAVGAHVARRAYIPAGSAARVLDAVSLLHGIEEGDAPQLGRRVVVYGGGDTALDAARTARRLGASDPLIVYRRTRERMPAHDSEVREALEEGIKIRWLSTVKRADAGRLVIERMELDGKGFPQPTGELEELEADSLVLALGQDADLSLLAHVPGVEVDDGVMRVDQNMMTGCSGVFAGGDMVPCERSATVAVGHGKRAAHGMDAWLRGEPVQVEPDGELAPIEAINPWYYSDAPRTVAPVLDRARRESTFDEVVHGLDQSSAVYEARRCLSCGSCFSCDNCYGVCPDNAVVKLDRPGEPYAFDYDYCKGCGICVTECPCGAIEMVPELT